MPKPMSQKGKGGNSPNRSLLVPSMGKVTFVNTLLEEAIVLVVEKGVTR